MAAASAGAESPPGSKDTGTGTLDGRLTDRYSVPLREAAVVVRNLETGETARGLTGKNGSYRFTGLGPGEYRLEADVPGLGNGAVEGILVSAGHATRVQAALVMELPSPSPAIEIDVHQLDPVAAAVTTVIPNEELNAIPVATRNWQEFAAITPAAGAAPQGDRRNGGQIGDRPGGDAGMDAGDPSSALEGASGAQATTAIDGVESTPAFRGAGDRPGRQSASLGESAVLTLEAHPGESTVDSASSSGGSVNLATAHGGNGLHGQAFYNNRQGIWGARNPYTQWVKETSPATGIDVAHFAPESWSADDDRQTFGIGVGRQIRRNKLYWFAALDGFERNDPAVATVRHPSDFFARPTDNELDVLASRLGISGGHLARTPLRPIREPSSRWMVCSARFRARPDSGRGLAVWTGR